MAGSVARFLCCVAVMAVWLPLGSTTDLGGMLKSRDGRGNFEEPSEYLQRMKGHMQELLRSQLYDQLEEFLTDFINREDVSFNDTMVADEWGKRSDETKHLVYHYVGMLHMARHKIAEATRAFANALLWNASNAETWNYMGDTLFLEKRFTRAVHAFEKAIWVQRGPVNYCKLYSARNWIADWSEEETLQNHITAMINERLSKAPYSTPAEYSLTEKGNITMKSIRKIRLGFISGDFGVHPISSLIRGMVGMIDSSKYMTFCFTVTDHGSWWRTSIEKRVDEMISLANLDPPQSAKIIRSYDLDVLIDLSGHTRNSGLPVLSFRPAPIQITFLGYPYSTGSPFIDYALVDSTSLPPELMRFYSEKILYHPFSYLVNDHAQLMGHTLTTPRPEPSDVFPAQFISNMSTSVVYAVFSNWQKISPIIFLTWMNILKRVPRSILWFLEYPAHEAAEVNLRKEAASYGIDHFNRFVFTPQVPWINHTLVKQVADVVLDTTRKNGHTTILDALWAGIPIVSLEGHKMSNRAASSALKSIGLYGFMVHSLAAYEDLAVKLGLNSMIRQKYRSLIASQRLTTALFDTQSWTETFQRLMEGVVEKHALGIQQEMHTVTLQRLDQHHVVAPSSGLDAERRNLIQEKIEKQEPILLHVGGHQTREGWLILDLKETQFTDIVGDMTNLTIFPNNTVTAIYSSHSLEHISYRNELRACLAEWYRALLPGGTLYVSVPDLEVLASLYVDESLTKKEKFFVMRMMFGAQGDDFDYHKTGFNADLLEEVLLEAGFCKLKKLNDGLGLFADTSYLTFKNRLISLNYVATACKENKKPRQRRK